jgi:hypothetical protein
MEEYSVYGSEEEEEADDPPDAETDEERDIHEVLTILLYVLYHLKSEDLNVLLRERMLADGRRLG